MEGGQNFSASLLRGGQNFNAERFEGIPNARRKTLKKFRRRMAADHNQYITTISAYLHVPDVIGHFGVMCN